MKVWERPFVQLFAVFLLLGLFAWWTFQTISLPPVLRDLFEEDSAIATAAIPPTEEERFQQGLSQLPEPPENHAPEVTALLERLRSLPPVPYIVQAARQRDAAAHKDETTPPWSSAEQAAIDQMSEAHQKAWEPFFNSPPIPWDQYPDSIRLFRSKLSEILDMPPGYDFSSHFLLFPELNLYKPFRHLGALRFGDDFLLQNGWAALDTVALADSTRIFFLGPMQNTSISFATSALPPPQIEDIRLGLRSDRALFLSASRYLESLPPETPASVALRRFLGNQKNVEWFLKRIPNMKTASQLAQHLRQDADQILSLENKTFLAAPAWRQWLEGGNASAGLSPTLQDSLEGLQGFEKTRLAYQVATALCQAYEKLQAGDRQSAQRIIDPAQPGTFLRFEEGQDGLIISSILPSFENPTNRTSIVFPAPGEKGSAP